MRSPADHPPHATPRSFRLGWTLLRPFPARIGSPLRVQLLRRFGARIGQGVLLGEGLRVLGPAGLRLDDGASVARGVTLDARAGIHLAGGALIGFESVLLSWTHRWDRVDVPVQEQGFIGAPVRVGSMAWLGARSILLPGCDVGAASVVGAGAVVTRSLPDRSVCAGSPCRVLRSRTEMRSS